MLHRLLFASLIGALLFASLITPMVEAQTPSPQGQRPSAAQGPTGPQAPTHLAPEIRDAPYNGPSTKLPPGIQAPSNRQEADRLAPQLAANPAVAAAHQASQAVIAAQHALGQRMRAGQTPTEADKPLGRGYQVDTPRRSETPLDDLVKLLGVGESPVAEPVAEPDSQAFFAGFLCFVWENWWLDRDQWGDDAFYAQGLNYCYPPATNEQIAYMHVSMDIYKCTIYFITWDICLGSFHWYELWPSCETAFVTYLWCGGGYQAPRAYYPQNLSGAYFLRVSANVQTFAGANAFRYVDSEVLPYRCFQGGGTIC